MKLTRRQLYKLINESLNINEARVPRPRRLIKNIDAASSRVDTLIKRLNAEEGRYTKAELEADREELNQYLDNLKIALNKEGIGIKPRQRRKVAPVKNKIEDFLAGETVEPTRGTETAAQTPSGESNPKGKKTGTERKSRRQEVIAGLKSDISNLRKRLQDETNKTSQEALTKAIGFLEGRLEKIRSGKDVTTKETPPADVQKTLKDNDADRSVRGLARSVRTSFKNRKIIMTAKAKEDISDLIDDLENKIKDAKGKERTNLSNAINFLKSGLKRKKKGSSFEIPQVVVNTVTVHSPDISSTIQGFQEKADDIKAQQEKELDIISNPEDYASYDDDEPNKGKETLAQEPAWSYVKNENEVYEAIRKATLTKRTVLDKSNAGNLLGKLSMSAFKGSGEKGGTEYDTPEKFLNSGTETSEYFHKDGSTKGNSYDLYLRREGDLDDERTIPTFTVFVDGSLLYNSTIKGYVAIKINDEIFVIHKSKTASVLKESNMIPHKAMYGKSHATLLRERYWGRY